MTAKYAAVNVKPVRFDPINVHMQQVTAGDGRNRPDPRVDSRAPVKVWRSVTECAEAAVLMKMLQKRGLIDG